MNKTNTIVGIITHPAKTFRNLVEGEINLKLPIIIISFYSILFAIYLCIFTFKTMLPIEDIYKPAADIILIIFFIIGFISPFVIWVFQAAIFHLFAIGLFGCDEKYKRIFVSIGYTFIPQIIVFFIMLLILIFFVHDIPTMENINEIPAFGLTKILWSMFFLWTLILSIIAVKEVYKLTLLKACLVVLIPTIIYIILLQNVYLLFNVQRPY